MAESVVTVMLSVAAVSLVAAAVVLASTLLPVPWAAAGAAAVSAHEPEASLDERSESFREQKDAIARAALAHVQEDDTLFLDGGTTTAALARQLAGYRSIHVVTNNLLVVGALASSEVRVTLIGGDIRSSSMSTLGPLAQLALSRLSFDKAFLGADGVTATRGMAWIVEGKLPYQNDPAYKDKDPGSFKMYAFPLPKN